MEDLHLFEQSLGYRFKDRSLLEKALTHSSFANESHDSAVSDNEQLEFLGDAVLDLVVGEFLMQRFPSLKEGHLSMTRAQMVSEEGLALVSAGLHLGSWLRLGKGEEKSGGREKPSILADAMEAVFAAVYLDGGFEEAKACALTHFSQHTPEEPGQEGDHKTRLQQVSQKLHRQEPTYIVLGEEGPAHEKEFEVGVTIAGLELGRAKGKSKKDAEQRAAEAALAVMEKGDA